MQLGLCPAKVQRQGYSSGTLAELSQILRLIWHVFAEWGWRARPCIPWGGPELSDSKVLGWGGPQPLTSSPR